MQKQTAMDVANWFLCKNHELVEVCGDEPISNLKLQKLLYYSQGTCLGVYDVPLFKEPVVAWMHGPVVESVYHEFKRFGGNGIELEQYTFPENMDMEIQEMLDNVYQVFGQYSAWRLREMTHEETPWKSTNPNEQIDLDCIKKYFKENYIDE